MTKELDCFGKNILIANRGEIAMRVIRASHHLGMKAVSIYSYEDRLSMHRYTADESYQIAEAGELTPVGAYLAIDKIISIAKKRSINVIHPGYGFLSENPEFARKVEAAGIAFAGPSPEVIDSLGDKTKARALAEKAKVSVVPGSGPIQTFEDGLAFIEQHGFPIIIKAAFGGGGRGMRVVKEIGTFEQLFQRCRSEALAAFGDGTVFLERFLERPRHIEVQLLADSYGNVVHLFERDCSVQRRHQKVVEMGPALNLPDETRSAILSDAIKLAKTCGYRNAGTAEFLVDQQNRHYFIEINPRIQVEHTVTEEITGVDLVAAQIQIALGASLPQLGLMQEHISYRGVAIQCRVTTEDPSKNFQPDMGRIILYRSAGGHGIRLDGGPGYTGAIISPHYDSLLVKVTSLGRDFENARRTILTALNEFKIKGLKTNIPFVINLLNHSTFKKGGSVWTTFIDDTPELFKNDAGSDRSQKLLKYLGELVVNGSQVAGQVGYPKLTSDVVVPSFVGFTNETLEDPCREGRRLIFLQHGAKAFCKAIRAHKGLLLTDTTWRDAHQSLLATRVRTIDIARIAKQTSHVFKSLFSIECWGGATFDVSMRFLTECPWERLRTLRALVPCIPFQMLLRGANAVGYTSYPDNVIYAFCKKARECGVDIFRVFDSLNYDQNLYLGIQAVRKAGGIVEAAMSYTGDISDPQRKQYNLQYFMDLADKLVAANIDILAIKDMAGLLKPKAATLLISSLRAKYPDLVIHVHTHDTAGTGVASMIAAAEAGADIVDAAIDSMSGLTSQPSLGAIVGAVKGTELDTGLDQEHIYSINSYWEQIRLLYSCFDPNVKSSDSTVYLHEMPGGQYTNLLFQSQQLGLGEQWSEIKQAYRIANRLCGDITKVTPSSKVVGDFAQFLVSQKLSEQDVWDNCETLSFPTSVLEYFQGYLGQPPYGFPEPLRTRILKSKNLTPINGRPGQTLPPFDFINLKITLEEQYGSDHISETDLISASLYPKVFQQFKDRMNLYGDLTTLPTHLFLTPLKINQEFSFEIATGKTVIIKLIAIGPLNPESQTRDIYFNLNGENRLTTIKDTTITDTQTTGIQQRAKVTGTDKNQVGAPMSGVVIELRVQVGQVVKLGDPIAVLSAMKMETTVTATQSGLLDELFVEVKDSLSADDLIAIIKPIAK
ncbi:hypothetical protein BC833DRAFT_531652 [Globomyces pollinis-pini]|nr:hypothetical protein BC833DRAFT_531652 [Globomyces pollinis-pini]